MIEIVNAYTRSGNEWCTCCQKTENTKRIKFSQDGTQGISVVLCKDCRRELVGVVAESEGFEMTKERIEIVRKALIPFVQKELIKINNEGLGVSDAKEFGKDMNEILNLAIKALEQQPSDDCVSRAEVIKSIQNDINISFEGQRALEKYEEDIKLIIWCLLDEQEKKIKALSPVTPTRKSGLRWIERFDNEDKWLECPHCHKDSDNAYSYCPNCVLRKSEVMRNESIN